MHSQKFGKMIREARREAHVTLHEAAILLGVSAVYVSEVELSKRPPFSIPRIRKLAARYRVSDKYLVQQAIAERGFFEIHGAKPSDAQLQALSGMARGELSDDQWEQISKIVEQGRISEDE
jgi:transcriptional regulator with XRE-family HTH domain